MISILPLDFCFREDSRRLCHSCWHACLGLSGMLEQWMTWKHSPAVVSRPCWHLSHASSKPFSRMRCTIYCLWKFPLLSKARVIDIDINTLNCKRDASRDLNVLLSKASLYCSLQSLNLQTFQHLISSPLHCTLVRLQECKCGNASFDTCSPRDLQTSKLRIKRNFVLVLKISACFYCKSILMQCRLMQMGRWEKMQQCHRSSLGKSVAY